MAKKYFGNKFEVLGEKEDELDELMSKYTIPDEVVDFVLDVCREAYEDGYTDGLNDGYDM